MSKILWNKLIWTILSPIQHNTIQYNTIQYNTIQYNTIQYNTIQYNTIQYNTIQYNTIQYNTLTGWEGGRAMGLSKLVCCALIWASPPCGMLLAKLADTPGDIVAWDVAGEFWGPEIYCCPGGYISPPCVGVIWPLDLKLWLTCCSPGNCVSNAADPTGKLPWVLEFALGFWPCNQSLLIHA